MAEGFNPTELNRRDVDRIRGYRELLDFYHGVHWEGRERRGEKRLTFNYARVFIYKVTSYLMSGTSFVIEALEESDEAKARARKTEAALHHVYEDNNLEQLDFETEIDCAILGDACYKVYLEDVTVARNLPSAEMVTGRKVAVIFSDEHNAKEAVVVAVYT
ncbi:hypothetical protein ACFLT4_04130 [Chloroflexota bacterium]